MVKCDPYGGHLGNRLNWTKFGISFTGNTYNVKMDAFRAVKSGIQF